MATCSKRFGQTYYCVVCYLDRHMLAHLHFTLAIVIIIINLYGISLENATEYPHTCEILECDLLHFYLVAED